MEIMMNTSNKQLLTTLGLSLILLTGCQSAKNQMARQKENDAFSPEDDSRSYRRFAMAQEAAGARHDGMLYPYHFDGNQLNSLGERKLAAMLMANDHAFPVVVYMNLPEDKNQDARQRAVMAYLVDSGVQEKQIQLESGPNPDATSSGAHNLARLSKTESESPVASNPTNPNAPGSGTGGGGGGDSAPAK
jgi:hypothetical protein